MQDTALWRDWDVHVIPTHANGGLFFRVSMFARALSAFVTELVFRRPDVVHLHISHYGSFFRKAIMAWISLAFRVPVVLHIHGSRFHNFAEGATRPVRFLIRQTLERADALVALGEVWATRLRALAPRATVIVVPNAVRPDRAVNQQDLQSVHVVFLGEVGERKGAFTLIEAWSRVCAGCDTPAHLTIAGDGELDRAVQKIAELRLCETVEVCGWLSRRDVGDLLSRAHVLVLPSRNEGQPMAILEAMAKGLCVIASDVGGIPEMLRDDAGLLVPPDSVSELAQAIAFTIADADARATFGYKAMQRISAEFHLDVLSRRLDDLYRQVIT